MSGIAYENGRYEVCSVPMQKKRIVEVSQFFSNKFINDPSLFHGSWLVVRSKEKGGVGPRPVPGTGTVLGHEP